ncbi:DNA helicase-2 / ATP-dependent DNA helicase PcrA [Treponema bryantii]|uniref:DNA 3'-5' helicase n=1 Tax=Treponema bryantii TaxID=163 RepID=A0A1H9AMU5_9SPIR|nr:UvrD-helicase domain-containing protein [Treponema bryantii]SEP77777.1 DNA helicase-2 / ATP-dependent DNA helicase PcrA [Treponema bryantii]
MSNEDFNLDNLNEEQRAAVTTTEGYVRVIAGAGSGKTRALTYRFAYLVNEIGILPSHILCVTFTNKAAAEMRNRIRKLTGDNDTGYISTFHGFCVSVLQEDSHAVSYPKSFLVLDNSDIDSMLQIIYEERGLTLRQMTFSNARDMIENRKLFKEPHYYEDLIRMSLDEIHQKYLAATRADDIIFYGYLYQEKKCFGLDYNDLLKFVLYIFQINDEIRQKWQERLEYIMIDEFQDIDFIQYELMKALCPYHNNLFVVGDPDQTIYTWRGADIRYLLEFDKNFPAVQTIMMNRNYRSTKPILDVANSLIDKNKGRIKKNLICGNEGESLPLARTASLATPSAGDTPATPPLPSYFHAKSAEEEAENLVKKIRELTENNFAPSDIAILYRAHYISRTIEEVFQREKIAYTLNSGVPFFDRIEIKDSLSYLRMIAYKDDLSFLRVVNSPKRNVGERRIKFLKEYVAEHGGSLYEALKLSAGDELFANTKAQSFIDLIENFSATYHNMQISELFSHVMNQSGYELALRTEGSQERLDNLAELKQSIYEYETSCGEECTLENYLAHAALYTNADITAHKNAVRLMTIHTAKGLEFPVVFIVGMNENMFPSQKVDSLKAMEEERRLAFVAVTRAQKRLYLSEAEGFTNRAGGRYPSRFIFDIDKSLLNYEVELPPQLLTKTRLYIQESDSILAKKSELADLAVGDTVEHKILGRGTILAIDQTAATYTVKFEKTATPRKMSFRAPLTKTST